MTYLTLKYLHILSMILLFGTGLGSAFYKWMAEHFTHCVWLNPEEPYYWNHPTVLVVGKLFSMFELTLDGLGQAVKKLVVKK